MVMKMENKIKTDVANALIEALWLKGFLSDAEREKVKTDPPERICFFISSDFSQSEESYTRSW